MRRDRELLPWLLGWGLLAAGATGCVLLMPTRAAWNPPVATAAAPMPASSPPPVMPLQPPMVAEVASTPPPGLGAPAALPGPIWQCEVNGRRIYADSPCGPGASVRALNEINRMNPTPILRTARYPSDEAPYALSGEEEPSLAPVNTVYVTRPIYRRGAPPRPARGMHPRARGAPRAHGI